MKTKNNFLKWCKRTLMTLPIAAIMLTFASCEKEQEDTPNPFEGADNHITSFVLTKGEVSYTAAVAAGTITVTVPVNVSLSGFTATYQLCENATINPDPAGITDWNSEQQFAVTAYNGTKTTYKYTVAHTDVIHAGAVVLKTQAEVDAFGQGGYTVIDGYLAIGATTGADTITSLAPLTSLKVVTGDITVNATYKGDLTAFEQLETMGELLVLSKKVKTVRFPKLAAVRLDMNFNDANAIETLDFPELTTIDKGLRIYQTDSLVTMNFPKLQRVLENVAIEGNIGHNPQLQSINFPELTAVGGSIILLYAYALTTETAGSFTAPKLETTAGTLSLQYCATLASIELPALKTVNGDLLMISLTALTKLQLPALTTVDGRLSINGLPYTSFSLRGRFPSLEKVGTFIINNFYTLTELAVHNVEIDALTIQGTTTLDGLILKGDDEFAGKLSITFSSINERSITIEEGFKKVGSLSISGTQTSPTIQFDWMEEAAGLISVTGGTKELSLPNLKKAGALQINLSALETFNLPKLKEITGSGFEFSVASSNLITLNLPDLERVEGNLSIIGFTTARKLSAIGFPKLETITGTLTIAPTSASQTNAEFKDLSGFSNLKSAAGITISKFTQLSDFSPLSKVVCSLPDAGAWNITGCGGTPDDYSYETMVSTYCGNNP